MLKEIFALSDQGEKDLKKGILSSAAANMSLILPAGLLLLTIKDLMKYIEKNDSYEINLLVYINNFSNIIFNYYICYT